MVDLTLPAIPEIEVDTAADAMRIVSECEQAIKSGGVSWRYLALVALEAASRVRGKPAFGAPEVYQ